MLGGQLPTAGGSRPGSRPSSPNPSAHGLQPVPAFSKPRPAHQPQPDEEIVMAVPVSPPPNHQRRSSLEVPTIIAPAAAQSHESNFSDNSPRPSSLSVVAPPENEARALMALGVHCALSLAEVAKELAPIPFIGPLVKSLTFVFQAVEKSQVNKEQWKLLQGRCVMVMRIAGARVTNNGGEQYPGLEHASEVLRNTIDQIGERAHHWNEMNWFAAFVQFQRISEEIGSHFSELDTCLNLFSFASDIAQEQWAGVFSAIQRDELAQLGQLREMMEGLNLNLNLIGQTQDTIAMNTAKTLEMLGEVMNSQAEILQNRDTTSAATSNAQHIVQTIRTVTNLQLPAKLLLGRQCSPDGSAPIKTGKTCDVYAASFLTGEKVAKKVFRIGMSDKENRFLRDAELWATFKSEYTLTFYGIGMESFQGDQNFQLYMVSPLMKNLDAVTYLKQHKNNPGMKEGIMRIITDAAKGLQYLHNREPPVVHSGIRGDNILVTDSGGGILGGFGSTKALEAGTNPTTPPTVMTGDPDSQRWMAPEMFAEDLPVLRTASDVWGWAMAALELISGLVPYYEHKKSHTVMFDVRGNKRPTRAKHADFENYALKPDEMWALLGRCWEFEPEKRPTIDEVLVELKKMTTT
ncbi:hypothetical protein FRC06_004421 [Ceratobasidium sp. 370]|nr:hypothetical protein FRC06_004421 [Ceratobasidium sp. 370]